MPERKGVFEGAGSQQLRPVVHPPLTRPCFVPIKRMETEPAADLSSDLSSPRFFRLILVDLQPELCREFEKHFSKWPYVFFFFLHHANCVPTEAVDSLIDMRTAILCKW
jgi:hypothetical protein